MQRRLDPWLLLSLLILGSSGFLGTWNGVNDWVNVGSRLQLFSSVVQLLYGLLALLAIPALMVGWSGLKPLLLGWLVALTVSGGITPIAWGGATIGEGVAVMILTAVAGGLVIWIVRRAQVVP